MQPTPEQEKILNERGSLVVLAKPGSGKTFTISHMIKAVLDTALDYKGVIAISFTNKASDELKDRALAGNIRSPNSFFGTIDRFIIREIIIPFFSHITHKKSLAQNIKIIKLEEARELIADYEEFSAQCYGASCDQSFIDENATFCEGGHLILQAGPKLALEIIKRSVDCRNYLKARYSHVFIDEYQDSGHEQHQLFLLLKELGLAAIAVGDIDQSIYHFSGKSSVYLDELTANKEFKTYALNKNHRCHPSISNYSLALISKNPQFVETTEKRVFYRKVQGDQSHIGSWLKSYIESAESRGRVQKRNEIGILCRNNLTANLVKSSIGVPVKHAIDTPLDQDSNPWSSIFRNLLFLLHDHESFALDFASSYVDEDTDVARYEEVFKASQNLKNKFQAIGFGSLSLDDFILIAKMIDPDNSSSQSIDLLTSILIDESIFNTYRPPLPNEVQLMTLHKSKGLEFEIVFHLDLYNFTLPSYKALKGDKIEMSQDRNLHYVGITRARNYCILVTSTSRLNASQKINDGIPSQFLFESGLEALRG